MQRVKNYGSFLQAFALQEVIKKMGHEVEFVDFVGSPYYISKKICLKLRIANFFKKIPFINKINKINKYFNLYNFEKLYANTFETSIWPFLNMKEELNIQPKLDVLVVGADEVFNYIQNIEVGYSDELFGSPNNSNILLSFAACCGYTTIEKLQAKNYDLKLKKYLLDFNAISVRDMNTYNIVKTLTNITPEYLLDPVFHYNFDNFLKKSPEKKPYIVIYSYTGLEENICNEIKKYAKKYNYKIICLCGLQNNLGEFKNLTAFEVLTYIKYSECVFCSTFHGAVFALKYNKRFCAMNNNTNSYSNIHKLKDLLQRTGTLDRLINNSNELEKVMNKEISYDKINIYIQDMINKGYLFLENNIKKVNNNESKI